MPEERYLITTIGHIDPAASTYTWPVNYGLLKPGDKMYNVELDITYICKENIKEIVLIWSDPYREDKVIPDPVFTSLPVNYHVSTPLKSGGYIAMTAHMINNRLPWHLIIDSGFIWGIKPPEDYEGFCDIFTGIKAKCYTISEQFSALAALGSRWWLIDTLTDVIFGSTATFFMELGDFFGVLYTWCVAVTGKLNTVLDIDNISEQISELLHIDEFTAWLDNKDEWFISMLNPQLNPIKDFIEDIDEYITNKIVAAKDLIIEWVADAIEDILDRIFKD